MNKRFLFCFLYIALLLLFIDSLFSQETITAPSKRARYKGPPEGTIVKDFSLKTANGKIFKLSDCKGKIIVLDFAVCTCNSYLMKIPAMNKLAIEFEDKDVIFYNLYTREINQSKKTEELNSSDEKNTKTQNEHSDLILEILEKYNKVLPILVDTFHPDCIQNTLGGGWWINSLIVIDKEGKVALWQESAEPENLRAKLKEMTRSR